MSLSRLLQLKETAAGANIIDGENTFVVSRQEQTCHCGLFMKHTICPHLYRAFAYWNLLDALLNRAERPRNFAIARPVGRPPNAPRQRRR